MKDCMSDIYICRCLRCHYDVDIADLRHFICFILQNAFVHQVYAYATQGES